MAPYQKLYCTEKYGPKLIIFNEKKCRNIQTFFEKEIDFKSPNFMMFDTNLPFSITDIKKTICNINDEACVKCETRKRHQVNLVKANQNILGSWILSQPEIRLFHQA